MNFLDRFRRRDPVPKALTPAGPVPRSLVPTNVWAEVGVYGWTMPTVQAALEGLEAGDLVEGSRLALAMDRDPVIKHGLGLRARQLVRAPFAWARPDGLSEAAFTAFTAWWKATWTSDTLASICKWRILIGVTPVQLTWHLAGDWWMPRPHVFSSGTITWREADRRYVFVGRDKVYTFTPDGLDDAGEKGWQLFKELGALHPWLEGVTRPLAAFWLMEAQVWRYWQNFNRTREPIRKLMIPGSQRESEDARELVRGGQVLAGGQLIPLPQYGEGQPSYDFDLLEATAATWETYPQFAEKVDGYKTLLLLGATDQVSGGAHGSRSRAEIHDKQQNRYLGSDAMVTESAYAEVARAWCRYNRLDEMLAPVPSFETEPPEDQAEAATIRQTNSAALEKNVAAAKELEAKGVGIDWRKLAEQHGLPLTGVRPGSAPAPAAGGV